jgi:prepilin-type N-terminal cleavage/methylation domain-containing protein
MKKGFTLIEVLTVLVVISIILLLIVSTFTKTLNNTKEQAYQMQINYLETSSKKWAIENPGLLSKTTPYCLPLNTLITSGQIKDSDIIDPRTDTTISGYIKIAFDEAYNQYEYKYAAVCP